jgi:hypothetical protein
MLVFRRRCDCVVGMRGEKKLSWLLARKVHTALHTVVAERQNHNAARTVAANSLRDDPVLIKFSSCGRFLSTLLSSGIFADNPNYSHFASQPFWRYPPL